MLAVVAIASCSSAPSIPAATVGKTVEPGTPMGNTLNLHATTSLLAEHQPTLMPVLSIS